MNIRVMCSSDLKFAAQCIAVEGWRTETQLDFDGFIKYDPVGCFIIEEEKNPIGIGIATSYGLYGFIGELIISEKLRGRGIGRLLLNHAVDYL